MNWPCQGTRNHDHAYPRRRRVHAVPVRRRHARANRLSQPSRARDRAVRARRTVRCDRPSADAEVLRKPWPAVLRREPCGRWRQSRHRGGRARDPGWLYHPRRQLELHDQSGALCKSSVRSLQRLRSRDRDRNHAERAGRPSFGPGEDRARADRLRARKPGQVELCQSRHRDAIAPLRRDVQARGQDRHGRGPVPGRRADDPVGDRQPHADRILLDAAGGAADQGRQNSARSR